MSFLIVVPAREEIHKHKVASPEAMDRFISEKIQLPQSGIMRVGGQEFLGIAGANCFCEDLPMNRYFPGIAGMVILNGNDIGFTEQEADVLVQWLATMRMSPEDADRHVPPKLEIRKGNGMAHIYVMGIGTTEAMQYLLAFIEQMTLIVKNHGKQLRVHYVSPGFQVPDDSE